MNKEYYLRRLREESEYAISQGKDKTKIEEVNNLLIPLFEKGYTDEEIKTIINYTGEYLWRKTFTPLSLNIGEFIFKEMGVSVNKRNDTIKMDSYGIYYDNAYKLYVKHAIDSYTDVLMDINVVDIRKPYTDYIFILAGGKITNIAFRKAYLKKSTIDKHSFYPASSIPLDAAYYVFKDQYITVIRYNPKFNSLASFYDLEIKEFQDIQLKNFGVSFNINKNELFSKGKTFSI